MRTRQGVLARTLDVGAASALESRLADRESARHAEHAAALRDALELLRLYEAAGMFDAVPAQLALLWRCSETRAMAQLTTARVLVELPGALDRLDSAVLTAEQAAAVGRVLDPLEPALREAVWSRVAARLDQDVLRGRVCPPARLAELMRTWAVEADADAAIERRRRAEAEGDVLPQRRDDGLVDLLLRGLTAPLAEAILPRVTAHGTPFGAGDERSPGKLRLDAAVDLLLGRTGRPSGAEVPDVEGVRDAVGCGGRCGCPLDAPVPCGAKVTVLVPLATALGMSDVPAAQSGHGPLEPDLLAALLAAGPELTAAFVDDEGTPVAVGDRVERPHRGDVRAVWEALRRLVAEGPGPLLPRHPDDHETSGPQPPEGPPGHDGPPDSPPNRDGPLDGPSTVDPPQPPSDAAGRRDPSPPLAASGRAVRRPRLRTRPHPPGPPGPYRVPSRLRRLVSLRSPRCEWPGCGARVSRCDLDHDVAWPDGPTCACNVGPLCRRHHRVKQLGWTKLRTEDGVRWTGPTGRTVLSPRQGLPVPLPRAAGSARVRGLDPLSPSEREHELWLSDPADPFFDGLQPEVEGLGSWQRAAALAEQSWWVGELAALRRDARRAA